MARTLTNEIIDAAIEGFEAQKRRIDDQIAELKSMRDGHVAPAPSSATPGPRKRKFSPDALRRMREAQKRRWARVRGERETSAPKRPSAPKSSAPKKKRRLSAAGRKAIQDALRRRRAQKRAEAGAPKAATKKTTPRKAAKAQAKAPRLASRKKAAAKPAQTTTTQPATK